MNARKLVTFAVLALAISSIEARAAEVLDVRIGQHPGYTRVVFELDEAADYKVQWRAGTRGQSELVVNLDATCSTRVKTSRSKLVESVQLEPRTDGAVAFIRLKAPHARLGEMLLDKPPRIVFDIRDADQPESQATPPKEAPPAEDESEEAAPFADAAPSEPTESAAAPAAPTSEPAPEETPAATQPEPTPEAEPVAEVPAEPTPEEAESDLSRALSEPEPEAPPAAPEEPAAEDADTPPVSSAVADGESGSGLRTLLGIGAIVLALAFVWLGIRRRSQASSEALSTIDDYEPEEEYEETDAETQDSAEEDTEPTPIAAAPPIPEPAAEPTRSEATTEPDQRAIPHTEPASSAPPGSNGEPQGLEQTVTTLENRVEELTRRLERAGETRDRLQRQLEAHTEELRVQRSALARTQRVVRSLMRSDPKSTPPEAS